MSNRRVFLKQAVATAALAALPRRLQAELPYLADQSSETAAKDEAFWAMVREAYTPEPGTIWLNNLAFNPVRQGVQEAYLASQHTLNAWPLARLPKVFSRDAKTALRARLARMLKASPLSPELSLGIGAVSVDGVGSEALYTYLKEKRKISTWPLPFEELPALWVSPYTFTTLSELDRFVQAVTEVAAKGLPA